MTLRAWQAEALPLVLGTLRRGERALVSACTGAGKSVFLAALLSDVLTTLRPGWAIVITVPTEALVEQLAATLREHLPVPVGRWYGRRKEAGVVRVCCLPSLPSLVAQLQAEGLRCALWVGDEVHRAESAVVVDALAALAPARWLGLTATPYRSETGLTHWPSLTYRYPMDRAFREGVLVRPIPLEAVHADGEGDAIHGMLQILRRHPEVVGPGMASAANIADAEHRASVLGWQAYHSDLGQRERSARIEALRTGAVPGLVHVRALAEGVDLPWLRWGALTTEHSRTRVLAVQEIGRFLRAHPGKTCAWIVDPLQLTKRLRLEDIGQLIQAADDPDAEEREEREAREAKEAAERVEAARLVSEAAAKLAELRFVQPAAGGVSPWTLARLEKAEVGTRWLRKADRDLARTLLDARESLDEGTARGLLDALQAARREAAQRRAAGQQWPAGQLELASLAS